jgi:hypothetical protein
MPCKETGEYFWLTTWALVKQCRYNHRAIFVLKVRNLQKFPLKALSIALAYQKEWPLLIVCPSSMRFAWKTAILKWIPSIPQEDILVVTGGIEIIALKIS